MQWVNSDMIEEAELKRQMILGLDGDRVAYKSVLLNIAERVRRYLARRIGESPQGVDVEDVVQIVLIALHEKRDTYDRTRPLLPWIYGIARYKYLEHLRSARKYRNFVAIDDVEAVLPSSPVNDISPAIASDIETVLALLPKDQREIVRMTKLEGRTNKDVALETGLSVSAVKVRTHRAMQKLRAILNED